jgi:hypothetical protein
MSARSLVAIHSRQRARRSSGEGSHGGTRGRGRDGAFRGVGANASSEEEEDAEQTSAKALHVWVREASAYTLLRQLDLASLLLRVKVVHAWRTHTTRRRFRRHSARLASHHLALCPPLAPALSELGALSACAVTVLEEAIAAVLTQRAPPPLAPAAAPAPIASPRGPLPVSRFGPKHALAALRADVLTLAVGGGARLALAAGAASASGAASAAAARELELGEFEARLHASSASASAQVRTLSAEVRAAVCEVAAAVRAARAFDPEASPEDEDESPEASSEGPEASGHEDEGPEGARAARGAHHEEMARSGGAGRGDSADRETDRLERALAPARDPRLARTGAGRTL